MRIIGLYGHASCGKSWTLNELEELLRAGGQSISQKPHPWCENPETFKYKNLMVCVAPSGDTYDVVVNNCRYFKSKGCDVAISATRTKWGPVDALKELADSEGVEIEWVAKSYEHSLSDATQKMCNKETAEVLLRMI